MRENKQFPSQEFLNPGDFPFEVAPQPKDGSPTQEPPRNQLITATPSSHRPKARRATNRQLDSSGQSDPTAEHLFTTAKKKNHIKTPTRQGTPGSPCQALTIYFP
jgi:hypothetical protein